MRSVTRRPSRYVRLLILLSVTTFSFSLRAQTTPSNVPFSAPPTEATAKVSLPLIAVSGNRFVQPDGATFVFRGLALSDPSALLTRGQWGRRYFEEARKWNANVVRIPVHPSSWRRLGEDVYLKMLDDAVRWSSELGLYVIIDWHTIGNMLTGVYHQPTYITSKEETFRFWYSIAERYKNNPTVALYELYNEPTNRDGKMGPMPWDEYRKLIEDLTSMIQKINPRAIVLVAGYDWGYDLTAVRNEPIRAGNMAYVTHPYPQKRGDNWELNWHRDWGFVAEKYPVVATEFGFMSKDGPGAHVPVIGDEKYGEAIIAFFEKRGISWTPWVFDAEWSPQLLENWDYTPTRQGTFFREKLRELNNASSTPAAASTAPASSAPAPIPAKPLPPGLAAVIDFETGDFSQGSHNGKPEGGEVTLVTAAEGPVRDGKYAAKAALKLDKRRAEVAGHRSEASGIARYGWSLYIPKEFDAQTHFSIITQWHSWGSGRESPKDGGPPTCITISKGKVQFKLLAQGDDGWTSKPTYFPMGSVEDMRGRWNDYVMEVNWQGPGKGGWLKLYHDDKLVIDYKGTTWYDGKDTGPYFKLGTYKGGTQWRGTEEGAILYMDAARMALGESSTYKMVDPKTYAPKPVRE